MPQIEDIDWHEYEKNVVRNQQKKEIPNRKGRGCLGILLVLALSLLFSFSVKAQKYIPSDHADYIGISAGTLGENYLRWEHSVTDRYVLLQASLQGGPSGLNLQYKLGVGYAPRGSKIRAYIFMPYFNLSLREMKYNTPFSAEGFYDYKRWQASLNLDIYTQGTAVVPSIRAKYRILKFRL